ncbi:uncharacterized protein A4U43_C05F7280 [Asparagus officinalis]|uniref:Endonuclease/exonuclease/phosphatase domain-containing protein n=2 Tax=Asparagus officinalis TaxID=4686 RepID=A0A5P1EQ84_ASPOF|nr:uncharacterized protein A4U43_C05F7280 [Asparagus officinalis]
MGFAGQSFTWSRGLTPSTLISKRLDRFLMNLEVCIKWPNASVRHLPKFGSDHTPLLLSLEPKCRYDKSRRPFRFEIAWLTHPDFLEFIHQNWKRDCPANIALAALKDKLLDWNRKCFGNIHEKKTLLLAELDKTQMEIKKGPTSELIAREEQ